MERRVTVLLVQEEPLMAFLHEQLLETTEFEFVTIAPCNHQALTWLQSNRPGLAVVDFF
jgi:response regulator of citrate/malate metabolism